MTVFGLGDRGKFAEVSVDTSPGEGIILKIPGGGDPVGSSSLITSFSAEQAENYAISQCLNGGVFLYSYGHDPQRSTFSVGVTSFLRSCDGFSGESLIDALNTYDGGRVSETGEEATLTVGQGSLHGYLVGQSVSVVSNILSMICANYTFVALTPQ